MSTDVEIVIKARNEAQAAINAVKGDLQQLGGVASGLKAHFADMGATLRNVGMGLTAAVTAPVVAMGATALSAASDFEGAMNVMQQVSGATASDMAQLQAQALELGRATSFSAGEAADAMLELGKAGMSVADVTAALPGVLTLAAAGGVDMAEAASLTTAALNAFGLEAAASADIANMFAAAANASAADISDLGQGFQQAGFAFAASKQSAQDLTASLALLTNVGLTGSDAGTALKNAMMRLMNPTKEAAAAMAQLGIDVFDAKGQMLPWADVIQEFSTATAGLSDETKQAALSTILMGDGMKAMLPLLDAGKTGFLDMKAAVEAQGAAQAVADARMKGLGGAVEYFKGTIESTLIEAVLPFMDGIAAAMRQAADFVAGFSRIAPEVRNVIVVATAAAAAVGPLLIGLGMVSSAIGSALPVLAAAGGAIAALASPIGLVVAAVGALGVAFATDFAGIRTATMQALNPLIAGAGRVRQAFATGMVTAGGILDELRATLLGLGGDSATAEISLQELATIFTGSAEAGAQFQAALAGIGSVLTPMRQAIDDVFAAFQRFGASGTWANLTATVTGSLAAIGAAFAGLFSGRISLPDLAGQLGAQLGRIGQGIRAALGSADLGDLRAGIVGALGIDQIDLGALRDSLAGLASNVASAFTTFDWGGALATAGGWVSGLTSWVVGSITGIDWGGALTTAGEWLSGLTSTVATAIVGVDWGLALTAAGVLGSGLAAAVGQQLGATNWAPIAASLATLQTTVVAAMAQMAGAWVALTGLMAPGLARLQEAFTSLGPQIAGLGPEFTALMGAVQTMWTAVQPILQDFGMLVAGVIAVVSVLGVNLLAEAFNNFGVIVGTVMSQITLTLNSFAEIFTSTVAAVKALFAGDFKTAWAEAGNVVATFKEFVGGTLTNLWTLGSTTIKLLYTAVTNTLKDMGVDAEGIMNGIKTWWDSIWGGMLAAVKPITDAVGAVQTALQNIYTWLSTFSLPNPFEGWSLPDMSGLLDQLTGILALLGQIGVAAGGGGGSGSGGSGGSGQETGGDKPAAALGTSYFSGGWSWVGESGRELVRLPRGSEVVSNRQSERMAAGLDRIAVNIQQMIVRDDKDIYAVAYQVADILTRA